MVSVIDRGDRRGDATRTKLMNNIYEDLLAEPSSMSEDKVKGSIIVVLES